METRNINKSPSLNSVSAPLTGETDAAKKAEKSAKANAAGAPVDVKAPGGPGTKGVNVAISSQSRELADAHKKALEIARNTPDVREDRVADLKGRIAAGTYQVDSGKIADGMMREALLEHLSEREEKI